MSNRSIQYKACIIISLCDAILHRRKLALDKRLRVCYTVAINRTVQKEQEKLMVMSDISFDGYRKTFSLPDEVMINPDEIIDDKEQVYRVSLGRADYTENEAALYKLLFDAIDKKLLNGQFLDGVTIKCCSKQLKLASALVIRTINKYGRFYELEAVKDEITYSDIPPKK